MSTCRLVVFCFAVVLEVVTGAVLAGAATLTVRRHGASQFDCLQAAVDFAAPGDTIDVGPGVYADYQAIRLNGSFQTTDVYVHITVDDLTIIGAGADQTIIGPAERYSRDNPDSPRIIWAGNLSRLTVRGVTIRNGRTGIHGPNSQTTVADCRFTANNVGIRASSQRAEIDNCIFTGFEWSTTTRDAAPDLIDSADEPLVLPFAVGVEHRSGCEFSRLRNCQFLRAGADLDGVDDFAVTDCQFSDPRYAISVGSGSHGTIANCAVVGARNNAIYITSSVCTMTNVEIVGGNGGISVSYGQLTAESITVRETTGHSFRLNAPAALVVHNSNILPASGQAVKFETGLTPPGRTYDMTGNFWGTIDGAAIADLIWDRHDSSLIDDEIDYEPFLPAVAAERRSLGAVKAAFR